MCISYINRLKSAPKAPKFLGDFGLLIRKPPLVLAAFGTRGGFLIIITTDWTDFENFGCSRKLWISTFPLLYLLSGSPQGKGMGN